jgi:hypothetical protein
MVLAVLPLAQAVELTGWLQIGDRIASSPAGVSLIAIWCCSPRLSIQVMK